MGELVSSELANNELLNDEFANNELVINELITNQPDDDSFSTTGLTSSAPTSFSI